MKKLITFTAFLTSLFAYQIQPLTEPLSPYQIVRNNILSGISVDIVREIQKRIGNTKKILVLPWNRAYIMTLKKEGFALFSTVKTKQRENKFKWVGPIGKVEIFMYKNVNNHKVYKTLNDARKVKSIAVIKNDAVTQYLQAKHFHNLNIAFSRSSKTNLEKVAANQSELFPMNGVTASYRIKELGLKGIIVKTKIPPFIKKDIYIAFNKNTPDNIIKKWQKALDEIKKDGTYNKILGHYK